MSVSVVGISDHSTLIHEKRNTKFIIHLKANNQEWSVTRHYTEFHAIYTKLRESEDCTGLQLPGNNLLGIFTNRRKGLYKFVKKLVSTELLIKNEDVRLFLDLHKDKKLSNLTSSHDTDLIDLGPTEDKKASLDDFEIVKTIGEGNFGKVYLAVTRKTNQALAIKVLKKDAVKQRKEVDNVMSERNVLVKSLNHPFLCKLHLSFQSTTKLYFVLDYINGGELFYHIQRERVFTETRTRFYAAQIASALGYLHSENIIYRDLKPENILLDSKGYAILTDFGLCKQNSASQSTTLTFCGTPEYLAPEILRKQPYDFAVDWWCLGCVIYEMLHGLPPFYSENRAHMYRYILERPLRTRNTLSSSTENILFRLLQKDKISRLGSENDFEEISKHRFFKDIDWIKLLERKLTAPFLPSVTSSTDTRNISPEFVNSAVPNSVICSVMRSRNLHGIDETFSGFSYIPTKNIHN
ncbi:Serine/threonine-protein kinase Sgk1 [Schistosoma haematobium]|uniref:Serine/threonine-protein kinase Sgk1 n=3 Tax=Schistosoma haematobium TaxID=6185 RepID=A0A922S1L6_SCHHA|nr:Serine/threonine-protein kinase Sgk1 [Schistosoma haematobium]KAH9589926.1 Serine/threonine-protein kinase Sgk1 [Schistosoma haematobium]CAH8646650.1 unnamed protein product [Schistosoma haematobium]CAH8654055.1 unnamed protein product [Schistosoma haematobium]